jgi:hypothetical protein
VLAADGHHRRAGVDDHHVAGDVTAGIRRGFAAVKSAPRYDPSLAEIRRQGAPVKTKAAVLWEPRTEWVIEEIELDPPKDGEVLVELAASGLCHSDEHARYPLEQINEGYQAMRDGTNIRGVITFR